jgi:hypothetical protein
MQGRKTKESGHGREKDTQCNFQANCKSIRESKCERCVKVFNSSVEKRVEKNVLKMKSPVLRVACAHCTIVVQSLREKLNFH